MFDLKKWAKRVGIVFLVLVLLLLGVMFMPLLQLATYYIVQVAILMIQIAVALAVLKVAVQLILWSLSRKKVIIPTKLKALMKSKMAL